MGYYIEQATQDPSPGLRIIELHHDGKETVVWYLQTQHSHLILKEVVGEYLLLGDRNGKFTRFHIPTQTLTHTQHLAGEISIGAILSSGRFTIMVTMNNDNDYNIPYLVRLDCKDLSILSDFRLPFELNFEDDEEDDESEQEYQHQIDCYRLDVYRPIEPASAQLWLYACNANTSWDQARPHEFYKLDLLGQQESLIPLPGLGSANTDLCMPALNLAANLGVMLSWDAVQIVEHDDEQCVQLQLELFDIEKGETLRKLPLRNYSFEQLTQHHIDIDLLQAGPEQDFEEYCKALTDIYEELTDLRWQGDKLLLSFSDQTVLMDLEGNSELIKPQNQAVTRSYLPEAQLAENLKGRYPINVDEPLAALQQMLTLCRDIESKHIGDQFSFKLLDGQGGNVVPEPFFAQTVQQHSDLMIQMITHYCDYLDTTRLKTNLWEWCGAQASLGDVVYALAYTGDAAILPVIKRYVSFVDADHESFVKEELVPRIHSVFGEDHPVVQEISLLAEYDDGEWDEEWDED